jgi:hypothetical protein
VQTYEPGLEGEQRDRLVGLVRSGVKTMTNSLLLHLRMDGEDLPLPGQRYALVDSVAQLGTVEIVELRLLRLGEWGRQRRSRGGRVLPRCGRREVHESAGATGARRRRSTAISRSGARRMRTLSSLKSFARIQ